MSFRYGGRTTFGSCWNTMLASVDFVETYENIDGSNLTGMNTFRDSQA